MSQPNVATSTANAPEGELKKDGTNTNIEVLIDEGGFLPPHSSTEAKVQQDRPTEEGQVEGTIVEECLPPRLGPDEEGDVTMENTIDED